MSLSSVSFPQTSSLSMDVSALPHHGNRYSSGCISLLLPSIVSKLTKLPKPLLFRWAGQRAIWTAIKKYSLINNKL